MIVLINLGSASQQQGSLLEPAVVQHSLTNSVRVVIVVPPRSFDDDLVSSLSRLARQLLFMRLPQCIISNSKWTTEYTFSERRNRLGNPPCFVNGSNEEHKDTNLLVRASDPEAADPAQSFPQFCQPERMCVHGAVPCWLLKMLTSSNSRSNKRNGRRRRWWQRSMPLMTPRGVSLISIPGPAPSEALLLFLDFLDLEPLIC